MGVAAAALGVHFLYLLQPVFIDEELVLRNVVTFLVEGTASPVHTSYPTLFSYLATPFVEVARWVYLVAEVLPARTALPLLQQLKPLTVAVPARLVSLLALTGAAVLSGRAVYRSAGKLGGWGAALAILLTPGLLQYGSYALPDVTGMCLAAGALALTIGGMNEPKSEMGRRRLLGAFAAAGLAVAAKYSAAGVLAAPITGLFLHWRNAPDRNGHVRLLFACGGSLLAGFFLGSPSWLYAPDAMLGGLVMEMLHAEKGHLGTSGTVIIGHLELWLRASPILVGLALLGGLVTRQDPDLDALPGAGSETDFSRSRWVAVSLLVGTLVLAATSNKQSLQYLYPAYPAAAWFAGHGVSYVLSRGRAAARIIVLTSILLLLVIGGIGGSKHLLEPWTGERVRTWIREHVAPGTELALDEFHVPDFLDPEEAEMLRRTPAALRAPELLEELERDRGLYQVTAIEPDTSWLARTTARVLVTSAANYERYFDTGVFTARPPPLDSQLRREWERRQTFYRTLFDNARWKLAATIRSGSGPPMRIYIRVQG